MWESFGSGSQINFSRHRKQNSNKGARPIKIENSILLWFCCLHSRKHTTRDRFIKVLTAISIWDGLVFAQFSSELWNRYQECRERIFFRVLSSLNLTFEWVSPEVSDEVCCLKRIMRQNKTGCAFTFVECRTKD